MFRWTECVMTRQDSWEIVCCQAWSSRSITRDGKASWKAERVKRLPLVVCSTHFRTFGSPVMTVAWAPVQRTLYSRHPSRFIRLDSKAFRAPRWTWGLCSWWAVHIARQPRRLWTDGTPRLNPEVPCQCRSWCTTTVGDVGPIQLF